MTGGLQCLFSRSNLCPSTSTISAQIKGLFCSPRNNRRFKTFKQYLHCSALLRKPNLYHANISRFDEIIPWLKWFFSQSFSQPGLFRHSISNTFNTFNFKTFRTSELETIPFSHFLVWPSRMMLLVKNFTFEEYCMIVGENRTDFKILQVCCVWVRDECSVGPDDVSIKVRGRKQYVRLCQINLHVWWERGEA